MFHRLLLNEIYLETSIFPAFCNCNESKDNPTEVSQVASKPMWLNWAFFWSYSKLFKLSLNRGYVCNSEWNYFRWSDLGEVWKFLIIFLFSKCICQRWTYKPRRMVCMPEIHIYWKIYLFAFLLTNVLTIIVMMRNVLKLFWSSLLPTSKSLLSQRAIQPLMPPAPATIAMKRGPTYILILNPCPSGLPRIWLK